MSSGNCAQCGCPGWRRQVGQELVEVAEKQVAGTSPAEQWSGLLEPPRRGLTVITKGGAQFSSFCKLSP